MSKCIFCKKENDGPVCKHCLSKGSSKAAGTIKKGTEVAIKVVPIAFSVIAFVVTRTKKK